MNGHGGPALAALIALLAALPGPAAAGQAPGAGASMGLGLAGYDPAPVAGLRVRLPSLEVAFPAPGRVQPRLRVPVLDAVYHAALRHQLDLDVDLFFLWQDEPVVALGAASVRKAHPRPLLGPMIGLRVNAAPHVFQPGLAAGARFGVEVLAGGRKGGLFVAFEPLLELQGGAAGGDRAAATFGGGLYLTVGVTRYAAR